MEAVKQIVSSSPPPPPAEDPEKDFYVLLRGETLMGKKFRPSDWADRLYGVVRFYADEHEEHTKRIGESVCTVLYEGNKGFLVDPKLDRFAPQLMDFIRKFAHDNKLRTVKVDPDEWSSKRRRIVKKPRRSFV